MELFCCFEKVLLSEITPAEDRIFLSETKGTSSGNIFFRNLKIIRIEEIKEVKKFACLPKLLKK